MRKSRVAAHVSPASARLELARLLSSPRFAGSERHCRFLQFVVEESLAGRESEIKESVLAMQVFDRGSSFDPRTDSVVRSEARHLRVRLSEYYLNEGTADPVVIELPKGSYVPRFRQAAVTPPSRFSLSLSLGLAAALVIAAGGLAWWLLRPGASGSVAVLPFLNLTGDSDADYVADGLVEDLTTDLARLPGLRVAARSSAFQYRGKGQDVRKIGRELGVGTVLEGSLRREPGVVKITAQLINTRNGYHLWSSGYERAAADAQEVEREIVASIGEVLGVRRVAPSAPPRVPLPEARDAYWRGRYLYADWQRIPESVPFFEQAVAADPQFAEAWAALASAHSNLAFHLRGNVREEAAKAREAARRALELADAIPEAHVALAVISYSYDHDWPAAEKSYRRALDLNPSYAAGHRGFALGLLSQGRFEEAIEHLQTAQRLDPISILTTNNMATTLYCARRYEEAMRVARRHLEMDPGFCPARNMIALCELQTGKVREAIAELEKCRSQPEYASMVLGPLGYAFARAGRRQEAAALLADLEREEEKTGMAGVVMGMVHTGLGENRQAIQCLRGAAEAHVTDAVFIGADPLWDPLRKDPEFQALLGQLGLPVKGAAGR